jgi:hypothetical protein
VRLKILYALDQWLPKQGDIRFQVVGGSLEPDDELDLGPIL